MKLIHNWRDAWKMFSVQALLLIGGIQGVLAVLSEATLQQKILGTDVTWAALGAALSVSVAVIGALGRIIDQGMSDKT